jgi:hypothetical protein
MFWGRGGRILVPWSGGVGQFGEVADGGDRRAKRSAIWPWFREAQSDRVGFSFGGVAHHEGYVASAIRVLQRETGLSLSNEDFQLLRTEIVQITLPDNTRQIVFIRHRLRRESLLSSYVHQLRSR